MSELKKAEELKETIKQTFEANAEETELLVTADGNCFLSKDKNHAELHARSTNQKLETVKREDFIAEHSSKEGSEEGSEEDSKKSKNTKKTK